jgi:transcriptional regulator with XRE-family HTH domain
VTKSNEAINPRDAAELLALRLRAKKSQSQLARELGIGRIHVGRIERGLRGTTPDIYLRWHRACGEPLAAIKVEGDLADLVALLTLLPEGQRHDVARIARSWPNVPERDRIRILGNIEPFED